MQTVWQSFGEAWSVLKRNWTVVWFPFLMGLGLILALIILVAVMLISSGLTLELAQVENMDWAAFAGMFRAMLFVVLLSFFTMMAIVAGQAGMYARASAGERATTNDFFAGVRRFYWRFLGGSLLLSLLGIIFAVIFFGGLLEQLFFHIQSDPTFSASGLLFAALRTAPLAIAGFLVFLVAGLLLSLWSKIMVIDDKGAVPAILESPRFVARNLGPVLAMGVISWLVTLVIQSIADNGSGAGLLSTLLSLVWAAYYQLVLFVFYRRISGLSRSEDSLVPAEPSPTLPSDPIHSGPDQAGD